MSRNPRDKRNISEPTDYHEANKGRVLLSQNMNKTYNVTGDIIPQTILRKRTDSDSEHILSPQDSRSGRHIWPQIGFQSIYNGSQRRSFEDPRSSVSKNAHGSPDITNEDIQSSPHIGDIHSKRSSTESRFGAHSNRSSQSSSRPQNKTKHVKSPLNIFTSITKSNSNEDEPYYNTTDKNLLKNKFNKSQTSLSSSLVNPTSSGKNNPFTKVAKKLFHNKAHGKSRKDDVEQAIPNSFAKFLHSSYGKHRSPAQFIHSTTGGLIMDAGKSVYSYNPALSSNDHTVPQHGQEDGFDTASVAILHDLLKNLPSLEANYKTFTTQELAILSGNVWNIYCNIIVELFKNQRIWNLPAKIEDMNRILEFYTVLKTDSRANTPYYKFLAEIEEFLTTSLYIFENQIVFNYANEDTMNSALKRVGVIWQIFYQQIYYDIMAVLVPLEQHFHSNRKYWEDWILESNDTQHNVLTTDYVILKCFRDAIIMPYYQSFVHGSDGASKTFQRYIFNEEEESGVTEQDKLTLLHCFGILSTIKGRDKNQKIIDDLLEGVRISI